MNEKAYGVYSFIDGTTSGERYGMYSRIRDNASNSSTKYGIYNTIDSRSSVATMGEYIEVNPIVAGTGALYGSRIDITPIASIANMPIYGIYSEVTGSNSHAGFFKGKVVVDGDFSHTSDRRLKEDIKKIKGALDMIKQLKPSTYFYKKEKKVERLVITKHIKSLNSTYTNERVAGQTK